MSESIRLSAEPWPIRAFAPIIKVQHMKLRHIFFIFIAASLPVSGQAPMPQERPDEVEQLTQLLGLSEEQQEKLRSTIDEMTPKIESMQAEIRDLQNTLQEESGPGFDEAKIRETAAKLGELTGESTALSVILQSTVQSIFTEEQRQKLDEHQQRMQQMQQQMQQRQQTPPPSGNGGNGEKDSYGRSPGDPHYGHSHS